MNLNVKQYTTSCLESKQCKLTEEQKNTINRSCNDTRSCTISTIIPNSCLYNDYGHVSISYSCTGIVNSRCTFENGTCGLTTVGYERYKWTMRSGKNPKTSTGPDRDHTTLSASGSNIYTRSQRRSKSNDTSDLLTRILVPSPKQCLTFWYHMYGEHINTLKVLQQNSTHYVQLWSKSDNQGNQCYFQSLELKYIGLYKIAFRAIRGNGYKGDIAVDDISLTNTTCKRALTNYSQTCLKTHKSISIPECSKYYLQSSKTKLIFDQEFDNCSVVYQDVQASTRTICNERTNSDICSFNLSNVVRKHPGCFLSSRLRIEYKCIGSVVGIVVEIVLLAGIVVLIICLIRRPVSFLNTKQKQKHGLDKSGYVGNQSASLASVTANTNNPNNQCIVTQSTNRYNIYDNTNFKDDIINSEYEYSNIAKADSVINKKGTTVAKYKNLECDVLNFDLVSNHNDYDIVNRTTETSFIKEPIHKTASTKSNMVLGHQETSFEGSEFNKLSKPTSFSEKKHHIKTEHDDDNCSSEEGPYDFAGSYRHKDADGNIYSHTDNVYDSTTYKRNDDDQEDKYDHFIGQKTEDLYDTSMQT
ncbi:unnamed protein product [Mytilus coruscus]|uniref:MAM domain-containing protein n=1 Tax=Mytilus coruscus TaxID=42192 RepID=A0A6J7ZV21_MYTCO|nr:unnamed protein product [Mytilus coruscus]